MTGFSPGVAGLIIARDLGRCALTGVQVAHLTRGLDFDLHHRRPRGSGGTSLDWVDQAANGVLLSREAHNWVEKNRREARALGFLVPLNGVQKADEVSIRHRLLGLVYLNDQGGWEPVEEGPTPESMWGDAA